MAKPHPLIEIIKKAPEYEILREAVNKNAAGTIGIAGLPVVARALIFNALAKENAAIYITADEQQAERVYQISSELSANVLWLPVREMPLIHAYALSGEHAKMRIAALVRLALGEEVSIVASAESLMQSLAPIEVFKKATHILSEGDTIDPRELMAGLFEAGYEPVDLVEGPGQAAQRGDILDVSPPHAHNPYRIEFFGDVVDRITEYDAQTQRSIERLTSVMLPPAAEAPQDEKSIARALKAIEGAKGFDAQRIALQDNRPCPAAECLLSVLYEGQHSLFSYFPNGARVFLDEPEAVYESASSAYRLLSERVSAMLLRGEGLAQQSKLMMSAESLFSIINKSNVAAFSTYARKFTHISIKDTLQFNMSPAPKYSENLSEFFSDMRMKKSERVWVFAGRHAASINRGLNDEGVNAALYKDEDGLLDVPIETAGIHILPYSFSEGLSCPAMNFTLISELELYGFIKKHTKRREDEKKGLIYSELRAGDFVVHEAHGIGKFIGVEALSVDNTTRDYLLIQYSGSDKLYIPTDQLDRVQKYIGGEEAPALSKLGGNEWQRQVTRARNAVKELAIDLSRLYAERESMQGFAFSPDNEWQRQLEEAFQYQETADQAESIAEVKRDMQSNKIMDRLLCGDVGFGKTEVALRAAFKAVQDSKQVACLVPTTILAQQHYNTFSSRFFGFPVRVALLSRFKTAAEQKQIRAGLSEGSIDVVIGTHALLSKSVKYRDLGLLIIDEEQRFGVGHKEQIKAIRQNVDVLTLTATPIPRTLHMSMIGIRDLSVIDTPPEQRYPVETFVMEYSDILLRDALSKELGRAGQCYVVYNQVRKMEHFAAKMRALLPNANIAYAHGQMPEHQLESVMIDFIERRTDILLCSTIIENGLDISNVNTLFVIDADKMGLAQLYQLRGRVGRSTRMGYAYFTFEQTRALSETAGKRLNALMEFTQFGSGKEIALRDLEIRGAGSLLGANQHGHIADIGYEYYCKLMASAVKEAKGNSEAELEIDTVIDVIIDAFIPRTYIKSEVQRLSMYKRIAMIESGRSMLDVQDELIDRYGDIPIETSNLIDISLLKALAVIAHITLVEIRAGHSKIVFHDQAAIDGGRLINIASEYALSIQPGETLSVIYKKTGADVNDMIKALFSLLKAFIEARI